MEDSTVFVVDDDPAIRESIALLVSTVGLPAETFETANRFLSDYDNAPGCLVCDIRMPGLSGLELQEELVKQGVTLPVIILSGHGDVPAAVRAMKNGALDFIEKPFNAQLLLEVVQRAISKDKDNRADAANEAQVEERLGTLTPREREVLDEVLKGKANKVIALDLGISERTVELHRGRVMKKMAARSLAELMHLFGASIEG